MYYPSKDYRCSSCNKKLFEGSLPLLLEKKYTAPGETPSIEHLCPRCKTMNVFTYDANAYVAK
jgi:phage FluMu protein Com